MWEGQCTVVVELGRAAPDRVRAGCGWGMGAENQSFLFLKCNKSIRDLCGEQPGFWRPCCPGHWKLPTERHYSPGRRGRGRAEGGAGPLLSVQLCSHLF